MSKEVDCLLLAAGGSTRMGRPKLLMTVGAKTVLEIVLHEHLASSVGRICVTVPGGVGGFDAVAAAYGDERVAFLRVAGPSEMSESLKQGWGWLQAHGRPDGIMISLGDKPLVRSQTIDLVVGAFAGSRKLICVPVHAGRRGHPVILDSAFDVEIGRTTGDRGALEILARHPDEIEEVTIATDEILIDIDRLEDIETVRSRLEAYE
jgi:molybdenum cofactor cytidylyltransferase